MLIGVLLFDVFFVLLLMLFDVFVVVVWNNLVLCGVCVDVDVLVGVLM